jgi:hypothetical protein
MNKEELKQKFYTDNTVPYGNAGCRIDMPPNTVWNWIESNIITPLESEISSLKLQLSAESDTACRLADLNDQYD